MFLLSYELHPLLRPEEPRRGDQDLDAPSDPEINLHPPRRLTNIPPHNSPNQYAAEGKRPPIPLRIALQRRRDLRIRGYIAQHRRENDARDLRHAQRPTADNLPRGLETQQRNRYLVLPHDIRVDRVQGPVHHPGLDNRRHDEDDDGLQRKRRHERGAPQRTRVLRQPREEEAAEGEAGDGGEGFGPAVGLGGAAAGGGAQPDEDGVAGLHADEGAVGVVDGAVDEARDEGAG